MFEIITASTFNPVELYTAKEFLRITDIDQDYILEDVLIPAVSKIVEDITGAVLATKTLRVYFDNFPNNYFTLYKTPITAINSLEFKNSLGAWETLNSSNYVLSGLESPAKISLSANGSWGNNVKEKNSIRITFTCGYSSIANIPPNLKVLLLNFLSQAWHQRSFLSSTNISEVEQHLKYLLNPYKGSFLC